MAATYFLASSWKRFGIAFLAGITACLLILAMVFSSVKYTEKRELGWVLRQVINYAEDIMKERQSIFVALSDLRSVSCQEPQLRRMREQVALHSSVIDVVLFADDGKNISCSSVAGKLPVPGTVQGDFYDSENYQERRVWLNASINYLPENRVYILTKNNDIGVVTNRSKVEETLTGLSWQLSTVDREGNFLFHNYGIPGLFQRYEAAQGQFFSIGILQRACTQAGGFVCAVGYRSFPELWSRNQLTLVVTILLSLVSGWVVAGRVNTLLVAHGSTPGRVKRALSRKSASGFYCAYQPIVSLSDGKIIGCEVLARFEDEFGPLSPIDFINVIDEQGSTWEFSEIIIRNVVRDIARLPALKPGFRLSINFYPKDLERSQMNTMSGCKGLSMLREKGIEVVCEILETGIGEFGTHGATLSYMKDLGCKIAIDDFGTGFSNLKQLKEVKADYLKIDKSFVDDILEDSSSIKGSLVPHIVAMAGEMGIKVVAEGVESDFQMAVLRSLGVEFGQGYYFARPLALDALLELLERDGLIDTETQARYDDKYLGTAA